MKDLSKMNLSEVIATQNTDWLLALMTLREQKNLQALGTVLQEKMEAGQSLFDVWMYQESDLIQVLLLSFSHGRHYFEQLLFQATSKSFGERMVVEQFIETFRAETDVAMKKILFDLLALYTLYLVENDLSW